MKDIIIGISLLWLLISNIFITDSIIYNYKIGVLKEKDKNEKKDESISDN